MFFKFFLRGLYHHFGSTIDSIYIACILDLTLFHLTIAGASGGYHLALAFLELLRSILVAGLFEILVLPYIQQSSDVPYNPFMPLKPLSPGQTKAHSCK